MQRSWDSGILGATKYKGGIMNKRVKTIPFPEIENAYIVISGNQADTTNQVRSNMSFFYVKDGIGVEWEPNYGPITTIYSCNKDHPEAQKHWYFDYFTGMGHWGQLAVNENRLGERFYSGDYEGIFLVLKDWWNGSQTRRKSNGSHN